MASRRNLVQRQAESRQTIRGTMLSSIFFVAELCEACVLCILVAIAMWSVLGVVACCLAMVASSFRRWFFSMGAYRGRAKTCRICPNIKSRFGTNQVQS